MSECSKEKSLQIRSALFTIDPSSLVTSHVPSLKEAQVYGCLADAVVFTFDPSLRRLDRYRIKSWFKDLISTDEEQVFLSPVTAVYALKITTTYDVDFAFTITNKYKEFVPNFVYYYSTFICGEPVIDEGKVIQWCGSTNKQVTYAVIENIFNDHSLKNFLDMCGEHDVYQIFLQIANAFHLAYIKDGFTHGHLHHKAIRIRVLPQHNSITYYGKTTCLTSCNPSQLWITSNVVAYVLDFSHSTVNSAGSPLADIFELLVECRNSCNKEVRKAVRKLNKFFGGAETYRKSNLTYADFLNWIVTEVEPQGLTSTAIITPVYNPTFSTRKPETSYEMCGMDMVFDEDVEIDVTDLEQLLTLIEKNLVKFLQALPGLVLPVYQYYRSQGQFPMYPFVYGYYAMLLEIASTENMFDHAFVAVHSVNCISPLDCGNKKIKLFQHRLEAARDDMRYCLKIVRIINTVINLIEWNDDLQEIIQKIVKW